MDTPKLARHPPPHCPVDAARKSQANNVEGASRILHYDVGLSKEAWFSLGPLQVRHETGVIDSFSRIVFWEIKQQETGTMKGVG